MGDGEDGRMAVGSRNLMDNLSELITSIAMCGLNHKTKMFDIGFTKYL